MFISSEIRNGGVQHPIEKQLLVADTILKCGGVIVLDLCDHELFIATEHDLDSDMVRELLWSWQFSIMTMDEDMFDMLNPSWHIHDYEWVVLWMDIPEINHPGTPGLSIYQYRDLVEDIKATRRRYAFSLDPFGRKRIPVKLPDVWDIDYTTPNPVVENAETDPQVLAERIKQKYQTPCMGCNEVYCSYRWIGVAPPMVFDEDGICDGFTKDCTALVKIGSGVGTHVGDFKLDMRGRMHFLTPICRRTRRGRVSTKVIALTGVHTYSCQTCKQQSMLYSNRRRRDPEILDLDTINDHLFDPY